MNLSKWTPTLIRKTKGCKRAFEFMIAGKPDEVIIDEYEAGVEAHERIERYLKFGDESILSFFNEKVQREIKSLKQLFKNIETEKYLECDLICGVADFVAVGEHYVVVIDFKSRYEAEITQDDYIQLYSYLYMLPDKPIKQIGILSIFNAFQPLVIENVNMTKEELREWIKHQIKLAERRIPHMKVNVAYCRYCPYIKSCDLAETEESIEEIAQKYIKLKELIKRYEAILEEYVNRTGQNINVDGLEIGYHVRNVTEIDKEYLDKVIVDYSLDRNMFYKPDTIQIKKLAKKFPAIANAITIKPEYVFTVKKAGGGE